MKRPILIVTALSLFLAWGFLVPHGTAPSPPSVNPYASMLMAQAPPQTQTPNGPANLYGAAVTGYATTTGTGAMTLISAQAGRYTYLYYAKCDNTSASTVSEALIKTGSTTIGSVSCPPAGVTNPGNGFNPPLKSALNTSITFTAATAATTLYYQAGGYTDTR